MTVRVAAPVIKKIRSGNFLNALLRRSGARLLALLLGMALTACSKPTLFQQESYVFGTRIELAVYGVPKENAFEAMAAVLREFDRLHLAYHAWQPSQLSELNAALARGEGLYVSDELAALLRNAQRIAADGNGLFEPALGALIALWGFHHDSFTARLPESDALRALVASRPRISELHIDGRRISSNNPAIQIDLGGYLKGYALDRAAAILRERGIDDALINIGGNILALGSKGKTPWRIAIQHPRKPRPLATLPLYDGEAIGTSGDYQRYFEFDGKRYSHLIDPRSGWPADATQSLTVLVTPRPDAGLWSDVASKPPFIAGRNWRSYTRRYHIDDALWVAADGHIEVTRELRARLQIPSDIKRISIVD